MRAALLLLTAALAFAPVAAAPQDAAQPEQQGGEQAGLQEVTLAVDASVNLNITPRRVTLDRRTRSATVYVYNQGETESVFDVTLVDRVMLPNGEIHTAEEAAAAPESSEVAARLRSAREFVVAAPRRVVLAPGQGQTIRLRANPPPDAAGEYRTHLTVTNIPPPDAGLTAEQAAAQEQGDLVFRIQSIFGISIPVIVRVELPDVRARIENAALTEADIPAGADAPARRGPAVRFDIVRDGASSLFGNVEVRGSEGGEPLGVARGMGVYPEIERRSARIALTRAPAPGEQLSIVFTDDDTDPGQELARASLRAP